jgi:hypothetical protein
MEFIKAGGFTIVLVKVTNFKTLGIDIVPVLPSKEVSVEGQGLTAVRKYSIKCSWNYSR